MNDLGPLWERLPDHLGNHVWLVGVALALAVAVAVPLAVLALWRPRWRGPLLAVAGVTQTIPGLALLALMVPLISWVDGATGLGIPALGAPPTLVALTLYAILPVLRNGITGLTGVDDSLVEAATGLGLTRRQILFQVQLPLAAPVLFAGIRTAAVWTVGVATLATPVGQTCLGNYIFGGLQTRDYTAVVFGCVWAAALALVLDGLLGGLERARRARGRQLAAAGLVVLLAAGASMPWWASPRDDRPTVIVGTKGFTEQYVLAALVADRLDAAGFHVLRRDSLGSSVLFDALSIGEVDIGLDYSGTLWSAVLKREDNPSREVVLRTLEERLPAEHDVTVLGPLGFENAYALAVRRTDAETRGWTSIRDMVPEAGQLTFGTDLEFLDRAEWTSLQATYGLDFGKTKAFDATFMYEAAGTGEADVITAYTSDGRIAAFDLVTLDDTEQAFPPYDALLTLGRDVPDGVAEALRPLVGAIDVEQMRAANKAVDVDGERPAAAARTLAEAIAP